MTTSDIMVHYDRPALKTAQHPPPICPKCGSHRTEIIGLSEDGRTLNVRCNACGARSTVPVTPPTNDSAENGAAAIDVMREPTSLDRALLSEFDRMRT